MAQQFKEQVGIAELIRRSEVARACLSETHATLKHKLDFPTRIKESLKAAPAKWIGGSVITGFAASILLRPKKKPPEPPKNTVKPKGFFVGLLLLAFTMVKPAAKIYATKLLKDYFKNQLRNGLDGRRSGVRNLSNY